MDFIFGTLATDELKLIYHRTRRRGVQHGSAIQPRDPRPGEPVVVEAMTGGDFNAEHVALYYTTDGSAPVGSYGAASHGEVVMMALDRVVWDSLAWTYVAHWQATLPPQADGTLVRYRIGAWGAGAEETFADYPQPTRTVETAADAYFNQRPLPDAVIGDPQGETFSYRVDTLGQPDWAQSAIFYHVMVDRFYPGNGRDWLQTDDLLGICGGTLWGVLEKLDYIAELGANCIWLSPTWAAPSHHGYDVTDYYATEPRLGGDAALRALVNAAHDRGMRVLLDLVCNHISDQHPAFISARSGGPERDWFTFDDSALGYKAYFSVPTMPQVNLADPGAKAWMIDIARYWLTEFGIDGYRLDYAIGPTPSFWWDFRAACRDARPDCLLFGEVVDTPDVIQTYVGRMDGCLDFFTTDLLRRVYAKKQGDAALAPQQIARQARYFPADFLLPTFLDNHDMDRFLFLAKGDKQALRQAATVQMGLPQPPIIYYGTEVGATQQTATQGYGLHMSRVPMPWGADQDRELLAFYRDLIRARKGAR